MVVPNAKLLSLGHDFFQLSKVDVTMAVALTPNSCSHMVTAQSLQNPLHIFLNLFVVVCKIEK